MTDFGSTQNIYILKKKKIKKSAIYVFLPAMLYDSIFKMNLSDALPDFSAMSLGILTY